ncbi:MAG: putative Ig domain-containing protein, partial [Verrucomicrobiota bacterium]
MKSGLSSTCLFFATVLAFHLATETGNAATNVVAWGANDSGQSSVPTTLTNITVVAGGSTHSLALNSSGLVVGWGDKVNLHIYGETIPPSSLSNAVTIAAGAELSLALQGNGTVVGWGNQAAVPAGLTNGLAIAASISNVMALTIEGSVVSWGVVPPPPAATTNVVAIGTGNQHSLALKGDGTVVGWGDNTYSQLNIPAGLTNVVELAAGTFNSLALQANGTVVAWGNNTWGQSAVPAGLSNVVAIAAGVRHGLALEQNGSVVAWGDNTNSQLNVPAGLSNVVGIAAGDYHNLAVVGNGSPVITVQPVSQYIAGTQQASFFVMAAGLAPLSYQWRQDGVIIAGATNSVLVLTNLPTSAAGVFSVTVSNSLGTVTSANVQLPPVWRRPIILLQPQGQSVLCGDPAMFQTTAKGPAAYPLSYQWQLGGTNLPGATNRVLSLASTTGASAGNYTVVVSNVNGPVTSQAAILTVIGQPPLITSPLTAAGKQGRPFSYTITGLYNPTSFQATGLPNGLNVNTTNGLISGTPLVNGPFNVTLSTATLCASATTNLMLTITSSVPIITSPLTASGEQAAFNYQIRATESPTGFGATNLPLGLSVNPTTGVISGNAFFAGNYTATIMASNVWGIGTTNLQLSITSSVPVITSALTVSNEQAAFNYQILATESPTGFGATNLPLGLSVNPITGVISGNAFYTGNYTATITASNVWGVGTTNLQVS